MAEDENDSSSDNKNLLLVFSQEEPVRHERKGTKKKLKDDRDDDDDFNRCEDDEDDYEPNCSWSLEGEVPNENTEDKSFRIAIDMIKRQLKTYGIFASKAVTITAPIEMKPSEVANVFAKELERRETYCLAYLDTLLSDLNGLVKEAKNKRRLIEKYRKAQ